MNLINTKRDLYMDKKYNKNRLIAFIDILGFKELIKDEKCKKDIINLLYNFKKEERELGFKEILHDNQSIYQPIPEISLYSDNIIISLLLDSDSHIASISLNVVIMLHYTSKFQIRALEKGIAIRGAISIGEIYYDSNKRIILGNPLVEAISDEQNLAKYPRVIFSKNFEDFCYKNKLFTREIIPASMILRDHDGLYHINFFHFLFKYSPPKNAKSMKKIKNCIEQNIASSKSLNIKSKWIWMANFYNQAIELSNTGLKILLP